MGVNIFYLSLRYIVFQMLLELINEFEDIEKQK